MSVTQDQGGPDRGGDQAAEPADVEDLAVAAVDGGDDLGVAGQPAQHPGWELGAIGGGPDARVDPTSFESVFEALVVEGDQEPGGDGVGVGDPAGVEGVLGQGDQGVPEPGAVVSRVPGVPGVVTGFPVVSSTSASAWWVWGG